MDIHRIVADFRDDFERIQASSSQASGVNKFFSSQSPLQKRLRKMGKLETTVSKLTVPHVRNVRSGRQHGIVRTNHVRTSSVPRSKTWKTV